MTPSEEATKVKEDILEFKEEFEKVKPQVKEICSAIADVIPEMKDAVKPVVNALTEIVTESCVESLQDERVAKAVAYHHVTYVKEMCEQLRELGCHRAEIVQLIAAGLTRR